MASREGTESDEDQKHREEANNEMSAEDDGDDTEDAEPPVRRVVWRLGGAYVAQTDAGYPIGPPLFDSTHAVQMDGKEKQVRFTLQWIWNINMEEPIPEVPEDDESPPPSIRQSSRRRKPKRRLDDEDSDATSDDDSDAMPRKKNKRMTARQRAMTDRNVASALNDHLMALPMKGKPFEKVLTEAQLLKKSENARKRRLALLKQTEETKSTTVERLLMKTGNREKRRARQLKKLRAAMIEKKQAEPKDPETINYHAKVGKDADKGKLFMEVSFPKKLEDPLAWAQKAPPAPRSLPKCSNAGCENLKCYACKANGLPVCRQMECYKIVKGMSVAA